MRRTILLITLAIIAFGCEEEEYIPIAREDLIGTWLNQSKGKDYLELSEWKCLITRTSYPGDPDSSLIKYTYEVWNDTLELRISTTTDNRYNLYKCKLQFLDSNKQLLNIEGLEDVPPFLEGENFVKLE